MRGIISTQKTAVKKTTTLTLMIANTGVFSRHFSTAQKSFQHPVDARPADVVALAVSVMPSLRSFR